MKMMKRIGSALAAAAVAAVSMSSFAAFAQEDNTVVKRDPSKNYEYYKSLSDKEVYNEMCKAYGLEPSETFEPNCGLSYGRTPEGKGVPEAYWAASTFVSYDNEIQFNIKNKEKIKEKAKDISYFGFDTEYMDCFEFEPDVYNSSIEQFISSKNMFVVDVDFGKDSKLHPENISDFYRVLLTFANSQFAADFCLSNYVSKDMERFNRYLDGNAPSIDANQDGYENIDDALYILRTVVGINQPSDLEDCARCDIIKDGLISSDDALIILEWQVGLYYFC